MIPFVNAEEHPEAVPVVTLGADDLPAYLATQPEAVQRWVAANAFRAEPHSSLLIPSANGAPGMALGGIKDRNDPFAFAHLPSALPLGIYRLADALHTPAIAPVALGWGLGAYRFDRYRKITQPPAQLALPKDTALEQTLALLAASVSVRDLVNTPTEDLGPAELEAAARQLAETHGAELETIAGDALLAANFPAIHAVGRASHRAPRLIVLRWGNPAHSALTVIGKGVCFDTGGLDLKTSEGMRWMKKDMGGAAHALGLAQLVMAQRLPVRLTLLIPAVENAVGPSAYRPGEVLKTRAGISVEVDNTDAEGRLILCDALAYAAEAAPDLIVDFATLTGAARLALGPDLPALFANRDDLRDALQRIGMAVYDPLWPLPLWQPYQTYLRSYLADTANSGSSRMAGAITAALFLERFVPAKQAWIHLDTYAWNDIDRPGRPQGGEALGLRALFEFLIRRYKNNEIL